ncbi:hypothetical protein AGMMS49587_05300 [Spirochaetia bacterium]|nr:hypothetical protein AGMMS49587_05300 [Spirochaetia bacterium]
MQEQDILMEIQQISLEKRLEMLSERQKMYVQGYLDGILQAYKPLKRHEHTLPTKDKGEKP